MTLTREQSDENVICPGSGKRRRDSAEKSKSGSKKSRANSGSGDEKVKQLNPSQIEAEFRVLQSLIPQIAHRQQLSELEIIDACVSYIEKLQSQLQVKPNFVQEVEDEGIEEGYLPQQQQQQQHQQQTLRRLSHCIDFEDCNGNLEK